MKSTNTPVKKVAKTCANCKHKFEVRAYQRVIRCPKCKGNVERGSSDRHQGAGLYLRIGESQKDALERLSFDSGRSQADLMREAVDLLLAEYDRG
jgi:predicted RNA-binding Zn-ribbon protein involved in translation (DUF1610 family)